MTDTDETGASHCVKHRCALCHRLFEGAAYNDCPDCGGSPFCAIPDGGVSCT